MSDVDDVVANTVAQASRFITMGKGVELLAMLREADKELGRRLAKVAKRHGGQYSDVFTASKAVVYREQIKIVTEYVERRLAGMTEEKTKQAIKKGVKQSVTVINVFERKYRGIALPIQLDAASVVGEVDGKLRGTLIRRNKASAARYGEAMTGSFERTLKGGFVRGMSQGEIINKMVKSVPKDLAHFLHRETPRSFPDPDSGFLKKKYWAERIVRTETANALGATNLETIEIAKKELPGMGKKIMAHFDNRTAMDSMYVHGQIRETEDNFHDGAGREYLRPPARPNDRETIIPWRESWPETKTTRKKSLRDIVTLESDARTARHLPKRPSELMVKEVRARMKRTKQAKFKKKQIVI